MRSFFASRAHLTFAESFPGVTTAIQAAIRARRAELLAAAPAAAPGGKVTSVRLAGVLEILVGVVCGGV